MDLSLRKGKLKEEWANVTVQSRPLSLFGDDARTRVLFHLNFEPLGCFQAPHLQKSVENRNRGVSSAVRDIVDKNTWFCTVRKLTICVPSRNFFVCSSNQWPLFMLPDVLVQPFQSMERQRVLTDGSAFAPNLPRVRISGWSVVRACKDQFVQTASGLTSGGVHNIARAETMAVLKGLEVFTIVDLFCDNSGVVRRLEQILQHGFDFVSWRSHANVDLWSKVAAQIVS